MAPMSTVPAEPTTRKGFSPALRSKAIRARKAATSIRWNRSTSMHRKALLPKPALADRLSKRRCSCHQHRHQIRHRRAGDENPARPFRETEHLTRPFDDLTFDLDRNVIASAEIGIEAGRQHFRQHADGGAAAMHPSHEARVNIARRVGNDEIAELPIDLAEIGRLARKRDVKPRANLIRYRPPDRAIADLRGVVEHVIEHAMT